MRNKSRGNIESFITILPQVAIFLISIQLVFMQFTQSKDAYLLHGRDSSAPLNASDKIDYKEAVLLYTSPSPRDYAASRMPSSA